MKHRKSENCLTEWRTQPFPLTPTMMSICRPLRKRLIQRSPLWKALVLDERTNLQAVPRPVSPMSAATRLCIPHPLVLPLLESPPPEFLIPGTRRRSTQQLTPPTLPLLPMPLLCLTPPHTVRMASSLSLMAVVPQSALLRKQLATPRHSSSRPKMMRISVPSSLSAEGIRLSLPGPALRLPLPPFMLSDVRHLVASEASCGRQLPFSLTAR